jgi:septal ring factor EnvC (AmiA/AmiB activator)
MIDDDPGTFLPIWMMLSAAFGFIVGDGFGDAIRHRQCLQQTNAELRDQLRNVQSGDDSLHREIKQQRGVINDIHKQIVAVSKTLQKRPS